MHRARRKRLGVPVVSLVGYTNAGKSTLLNLLAEADIYAADQLFATLDPTTRMVSLSGLKLPDLLVTDTVGFVQRLPTHLIAAFRATLEEISEADVLLHVTDVSSPEMWLKQEAAVLRELTEMGLAEKPILTVWNKVDKLDPVRKQFFLEEARKRPHTICMSAVTGEGVDDLVTALEEIVASTLEPIAGVVSFDQVSSIHRLGIVDEICYDEDGAYVRGRIPLFLKKQLESINETQAVDMNDEHFDWVALARGRHDVRDAIYTSPMTGSAIRNKTTKLSENSAFDNEDIDTCIVDDSLLLDFDAGEFWHLQEDSSQRKFRRPKRRLKNDDPISFSK